MHKYLTRGNLKAYPDAPLCIHLRGTVMTQWQPGQRPRRDQPPATPDQWNQAGLPTWTGQQQPRFQPARQPQQQYPPAAYPSGHGQPVSQGYYQRPPVQVNIVQQNGYGPAVVTQRGLGAGWTLFHLFMTLATCGLWIPVWIIHASSARRTTVYR